MSTPSPADPPRERLRREVPARDGPVRNALAMFRPAEPRGGSAVERAVDNAYRVLEDHIRRGREAARNHHPPPHNGTPMSNDVQDLPRKAARYWADMIYMWFELIAPFANAQAPGGDRKRAQEGPLSKWEADDRGWREVGGATASKSTAPGPTSHTPVSFEVDLSSQRPARVQVEFHRKPTGKGLTVQKLQAVDGVDVPPIGGITLEPYGEDGRVALHVEVPVEQPAGTYSGLVIDRDTGRHCGAVTLVLRSQADP